MIKKYRWVFFISGLLITWLCLQFIYSAPIGKNLPKGNIVSSIPKAIQVDKVKRHSISKGNIDKNVVSVPTDVSLKLFRSLEDQRFYELETKRGTCDKCLQAGLLSQTLLAELCDSELSLQQTMSGDMYLMFKILFALIPPAAVNMEEMAEELKGNVDCTDPRAWGINAFRSMSQRGLLDVPNPDIPE